jgi:hypothetical protein
VHREYIIDSPGNYDRNKPYPLISAWHPLGGGCWCVERQGCDAGIPVIWCPFLDRYGMPDFAPTAIRKFFYPLLVKNFRDI